MGNLSSFLLGMRRRRSYAQLRNNIWTNSSDHVECLFIPELKCVISQNYMYMSITLLNFAYHLRDFDLAQPNMQEWYDNIVSKVESYRVDGITSARLMYQVLLREHGADFLKDSIEHNLQTGTDMTLTQSRTGTNIIYRYDCSGIYYDESLDKRDRDRVLMFLLTDMARDVALGVCVRTYLMLCRESHSRVHSLL